MKQKEDSPMSIVDEAVYGLKQLASLCGIMMCVEDSHTNIKPEDVAQVMYHLWIGLDAQIKALDGIQWTDKREKTVAA